MLYFIAAQSKVVYNHIRAVLNGKQLCLTYNGYTSCPLVTGIGKCILAEFGYNFRLLETFPIRQDKERYFTYLIKKEVMPFLYWNLMTRGYWNGPAIVRKFLRLGLTNWEDMYLLVKLNIYVSKNLAKEFKCESLNNFINYYLIIYILLYYII